MNRVFLSLGSNRGDSFKNIKNCMEFIAEIEGVKIINKSRIYSTKPMYNFNQKYFLNMVIEIKTILEPNFLLCKLQNIELILGRKKNKLRNQPREIDIDILDYNNRIINQKQLTLPHPLIKERIFVLKPWSDISPNYKLPTSKLNISKLMSNLDQNIDTIKIFDNK